MIQFANNALVKLNKLLKLQYSGQSRENYKIEINKITKRTH